MGIVRTAGIVGVSALAWYWALKQPISPNARENRLDNYFAEYLAEAPVKLPSGRTVMSRAGDVYAQMGSDSLEVLIREDNGIETRCLLKKNRLPQIFTPKREGSRYQWATRNFVQKKFLGPNESYRTHELSNPALINPDVMNVSGNAAEAVCRDALGELQTYRTNKKER